MLHDWHAHYTLGILITLHMSWYVRAWAIQENKPEIVKWYQYLLTSLVWPIFYILLGLHLFIDVVFDKMEELRGRNP